MGADKGLTSINPRIQRAPDGTYLLFHIAISSSNFDNPALPANCTVSAVFTSALTLTSDRRSYVPPTVWQS